MNHPTCSLCLRPYSHGGCECLSSREPRELLTDVEVLARLHSLVAHVDKLDPEAAHKAEDGLARVVLRTIADGTCGDPREAARAMADMLSTDRDRWFA